MARGEPGAGAFVLLTWLLAVAGSIALVGRYGANLPSWDDIGLLPVICGGRPITLEWLWSPHNEHRLPLNRLALATLMRLTGNDFRSGMFASVAFMGFATLILMIALRRIRGGWTYADAILPILLVGPSQHAVWLWCWELQFALSSGLSLIVLAVLIRPRAVVGWDFEASLIGAIAIVLLPLCGINGAVATPALAVGLVVAARQRKPKTPRIVAGLGALVALALAGLVVAAGLESSRDAARPDVPAILRTAAQFLTIGLGRPVASAWPFVFAAVTIALAAAAWPLLGSLRDRRDPQASAAGLLAFIASSLSIALATAWGRASAGETAGLETRYVTLAAPLLVGIYVALDRRAERRPARFLMAALASASWFLLWPNLSEATAHGRDHRYQTDLVERDLRARTPLFLMVRRHVPFLGPSQTQVASALEELRNGNVGLFSRIVDNPPFDDIPIDRSSAILRQSLWDGDTLELTGVDPIATFSIDPSRYVAGIQINYDHESRQPGPAHFLLEWRRPNQLEFSADQRISEWNLPSGPDRRATLWIADNVAEIRIHPDNRPGRFTIRSLRLLVPAADQDLDARERLRSQ